MVTVDAPARVRRKGAKGAVLEEIRISSLGVIDDAVLELGPGLTVITGETGAGKTMVVGSLDLLLGGKADPARVRAGQPRAVVEGHLAVDPGGPVAAHVEAAGGVVEDAVVVLSRVVAVEGRSRAFVGGRSVPVSVLAEIGEASVAVHGQSDQQRLLAPARQRAALDRYGGNSVGEALEGYRESFGELRTATSMLADLMQREQERLREADVLRFGLEEIDAVRPLPEEDVALRAEAERLRNAEGLRGAAAGAHAALAGDPADSGIGTDADVLGLVARARNLLDGAASHDGTLGDLSARVREIAVLTSELAADLASYREDVESDPARLETVETRRAALATLCRKYGPSVSAVLAWEEEGALRLSLLEGDDARREALTKQVDALGAQLAGDAEELSRRRREAADRFAAAVSTELTALAMPHARVDVRVAQREDPEGLQVGGRRLAYGPTGVDDVEILLAAHRGAPAVPLARGASGGELSRVMLAIEVVFAGTDPVGTFVFDEVDAGVGGRAATEVGLRLARLARSAQVLVVTHLAQVAAFADRHLLVVKDDSGSVVTSGVRRLDEQARVIELARMLAGQERSASAAAHARELLTAAAQARGA